MRPVRSRELDAPLLLEVALLDRRDGAVHEDELDGLRHETGLKLLDLAQPNRVPGCTLGRRTISDPFTSRLGSAAASATASPSAASGSRRSRSDFRSG
jgi:hypothetical protein